MKKFEYMRPETLEGAAEEIKNGGVAMAGGSDLLGGLKADIYPQYPEKNVSLKGIKNLEGIQVKDGTITVKAMTRLSEIAENKEIKKLAPALAEAAKSVATPLVRNLGTIGGNVCQDVRCWFYRYPDEIGGRLNCARKGGEQCYGILGDNRYHSIFGGMSTGKTPCAVECPAGTDIPAYMAQIRKGNWEEAAKIIMQYNPLPMLTSRVCPHTCQSKCNQCKHGDPVKIHSVERSLGDWILEHVDLCYLAPEKETGKRVGIVGAGSAGLTAAYYLRKEGHEVTVYDKMPEAGGVLMYGIPEYRLPKHYVRSVVKAIADMGVHFVMETTVGKDIMIEDIEKDNNAVFLDTGAWKQPILGIDGEGMAKFGLNFLVEVKGFMKRQIGKNVIVCGGGNVAMDVALTATRLGAETVTLVCLEQRQEMPASEEEIARALEEGVKIINGRGLHKLIYDGDQIKGLETSRCVSLRDPNGRFSPTYDETDLMTIHGDSVLLATGQRVDLDFLGEKYKEEVQSARGLIEVGEHNETRKPGVYAGGDAATGPSVAIKAIRAGANAAKAIHVYLGGKAEKRILQTGLFQNDKNGIVKTKGLTEKDTPLELRTLDQEDSTSLGAKQAADEAGRCMNCGCYSVNASDITPVLVALNATVVTTKKRMTADQLFTSSLKVEDMLEPGEIITEFEIPVPKGTAHYNKFRLRDSVDFAMVSAATCYQVENGRIQSASIVLGGVAPIPLRREEAEAYLTGKQISEEVAKTAADLALEDADPFEKNTYKVDIAKSMIKNSLIQMGE